MYMDALPRRGQAVLDCICMDEDVLSALGLALQLQHIEGPPPAELMRQLKQVGAVSSTRIDRRSNRTFLSRCQTSRSVTARG